MFQLSYFIKEQNILFKQIFERIKTHLSNHYSNFYISSLFKLFSVPNLMTKNYPIKIAIVELCTLKSLSLLFASQWFQ